MTIGRRNKEIDNGLFESTKTAGHVGYNGLLEYKIELYGLLKNTIHNKGPL